MDTLTGKARSILLRLPHFFGPAEAGELLRQFVDVFGSRLERAEVDLYEVLHAHHVGTADNELAPLPGAAGKRRGDLDRLLALYLEVLGGTSQLVKVSPAITSRSLDPRRVVRLLAGEEHPVRPLLRDAPGSPLAEPLRRYLADGVGVRAEEVGPALATELRAAANPLSRHVRDRLRGDTRLALLSLASGREIAPALAAAIAADLNERVLLGADHPVRPLLRDHLPASLWDLLRRFGVDATALTEREASSGLAVDLLVGRTPLSRYLRARLSPETEALLARFDGDPELPRPLARALAADFDQRVLPDPGLYRSLRGYWETLPVPPGALLLLAGIYRPLLEEEREAARAALARADLLDEERKRLGGRVRALGDLLAGAETTLSPPGDDLRRLNRVLLETAYPYDARRRPWGLKPVGIPSLGEVRRALVEALNGVLQSPDLARRPEAFPDLPESIASLRERYQGSTPWVNRKLLESAFAGAIESSHAPYRERLMGLIQVLRRGASTRQGIVDIVAANLGILGNDPAAQRARSLIEIEEYRPTRAHFYEGKVEFYRPFPVENRGQVGASPKVLVRMLPGMERDLARLRFTDVHSNAYVEYAGRFRARDHLVLEGSGALVNGIDAQGGVLESVPEVPESDSEWRFDADVVVPAEGGLPERELPVARFDRALERSDPVNGRPAGTFDTAVLAPSEAVVEVEVSSYTPNPGIFTVVIPWEIEGFTDKFDAYDHPRKQIPALVDRVKAAGVQALVAYKTVHAEDHATRDALRLLTVEGALLAGEHPVEDRLRVQGERSGEEDHAVNDALLLSGVLDHTRFDTLNTFG